MRTPVSALLALLALVVAAGGLASAWVDENLVDESGFVALAAPLGDDAAFQSTLVDSLTQEATAGAGLPEQVTAFLEPVIRDAAGAVTSSEGYPGAWNRTLRLSHDITFAQAPDPEEPAPAIISLDLGPVTELLTENVEAAFPVEVPVPENTRIEVGSIERGGLFSGVADAVQHWGTYLAAAGVLAVLALLVARRRGTTLALLGIGVVLIGALGYLVAGQLPGIAVEATGANAVAQVFVQGLAQRAGADLATSSGPVIVAGAIAVVVGVVVQFLAGGRRRSRRTRAIG